MSMGSTFKHSQHTEKLEIPTPFFRGVEAKVQRSAAKREKPSKSSIDFTKEEKKSKDKWR